MIIFLCGETGLQVTSRSRRSGFCSVFVECFDYKTGTKQQKQGRLVTLVSVCQ